jgi:hypothetical protein
VCARILQARSLWSCGSGREAGVNGERYDRRSAKAPLIAAAAQGNWAFGISHLHPRNYRTGLNVFSEEAVIARSF